MGRDGIVGGDGAENDGEKVWGVCIMGGEEIIPPKPMPEGQRTPGSSQGFDGPRLVGSGAMIEGWVACTEPEEPREAFWVATAPDGPLPPAGLSGKEADGELPWT